MHPHRMKVEIQRFLIALSICSHYAASKNWVEIAKALIPRAPPNQLNNIKQTPLHRAAVHGYTAIVNSLLESKCRVNPKDTEGNTPLHLACEEEHGDTATALLEHGANPDQSNQDGKTPLGLCRSQKFRQFLDKYIE
ncbi:ankyrin repeat-containing domain protein [Dichotomocladium elegans]|nr:ankyrin repeat-containing domain protein [Dichotomocladium elegans]